MKQEYVFLLHVPFIQPGDVVLSVQFLNHLLNCLMSISGYCETRQASRQPEPRQPQAEGSLHQTKHCSEENAGLTRGTCQWSVPGQAN